MIQQKLMTSAQKLSYTFQIGPQLFLRSFLEYLLYGDKYIWDLFIFINLLSKFLLKWHLDKQINQIICT